MRPRPQAWPSDRPLPLPLLPQANMDSGAAWGREETVGKGFPGYEFGGFLALRDDTPVLEEEDRFAIASLVNCYPQ